MSFERAACVMLLVAECVAAAADLQPKIGRGAAPPQANAIGPWATRIMLASSTNGLDFARLHFVLSDQAGVPNVVVGSDGRARVYYVDYGNGNILACAVQQDRRSLTNWTYHRVRIAGLPERTADPVDPAVTIAGTNQLRMYFMQARPRPAIYSALSTNGTEFTAEQGVRFAGAAGGMPDSVYDPCVLRIGLEWRLWCGPDGQFTATSRDGLTFIGGQPFEVEGVPFMPWSAVASPLGKGFRLYGNFRGPGEWGGGISSVFSADGAKWRREPGTRLSLGRSKYGLEDAVLPDNGCAILADGRFLLAYVAVIPRGR